jgi:anti-anti-sigma regulatory factor
MSEREKKKPAAVIAKNTIVVQLPPKPYTADELEFAGNIALENPERNIAVDCSKIGLITSMALCGFMKLRKILKNHDRRLLFLNVGPVLRGVFSIYGFDQIFEIVNGHIGTFSSSEDSTADRTEAPDAINGVKKPQRRRYVRMKVCEACLLEVSLWHESIASDNQHVLMKHHSKGRLLDVSLCGAQIGLDAEELHYFKKDQAIRLELKPYQTSLLLDAQITEVLLTADGKGICVGVEFTGLEKNDKGRQGVEQLCNSIEQYWQLKEPVTV